MNDLNLTTILAVIASFVVWVTFIFLPYGPNAIEQLFALFVLGFLLTGLSFSLIVKDFCDVDN